MEGVEEYRRDGRVRGRTSTGSSSHSVPEKLTWTLGSQYDRAFEIPAVNAESATQTFPERLRVFSLNEYRDTGFEGVP